MSAVLSPAQGTRLARFTLRERLGRGAQATVWRAHDQRLDRDVALKLMDVGADTAAVSQWLHEARAVSRLSHPHVVPVFEADEVDGQPYLVFELVRGDTLSARLRRDGALPPRDAVTLMLGVLDALAAAHAQGIVHRDLKPSNILLDGDGRARVMDFGIAARVGDATGDGVIVGTPGYMSPEAARGQAPDPSMDVFSAGMTLAETLSGHPLLRERDPLRSLARVQREDLRLPPEAAIDPALSDIVHRAIARDRAQRWPGAMALRDALADWLRPAAGADAQAGEASGSNHGTVEFLLRRMRLRSDFPALSDTMARIQQVSNSDVEHVNRLSDAILSDVALTHKLLRLVNSAHFGIHGGTVSTVSRAVALVGFAGIRNMALSLVLLEHMRDKSHAARLREEFMRALMAGHVAGELARQPREAEEAHLGGLLRQLGRLLVEYYFPDEAQTIRDLSQARAAAPGVDIPSYEAAATQVLGIGLNELGAEVARHWGLPDTLQQVVRAGPAAPPAKAAEPGAARLRWIAQLAQETVDAMLGSQPEALPQRLDALAHRHARALGVDAAALQAAVVQARERMARTVEALGLQVATGSPAQRLITVSQPTPAPGGVPTDEFATLRLQPTESLEPTAVLARPGDEAAHMLAAGIQDITDTMAGEDFKLHEVLRMILETMMRALTLRRVVFCLRDAKGDALIGRFGLGDGAAELCRHFRVPIAFGGGAAPPDLFSAVCLKGADTLIADAGAANIASRLPPWFSRQVAAPTFVLLPLTMKNAPFALIYADRDAAHAIQVGERELALLRTLRNQAVMAFRQAG